MNNTLCEECAVHPWTWMDDDGVLRCNACHAVLAEAWGGDYDVLIARRAQNGIVVTQFVGTQDQD